MIATRRRTTVMVLAFQSILITTACGPSAGRDSKPRPNVTQNDAAAQSRSNSALENDAASSDEPSRSASPSRLPVLPNECTKAFLSENLSYKDYLQKNQPSHFGKCGSHLVIQPRLGTLLFYNTEGQEIATATFTDLIVGPCLGKRYFGPVPTDCEVVLEDVRTEMEKTMPGIW
ncbi:MAG: hypothetical protein GY811_03785 [Myxococcales bacterium]|nr:hypothetical protein [Myxococcales bacterium]